MGAVGVWLLGKLFELEGEGWATGVMFWGWVIAWGCGWLFELVSTTTVVFWTVWIVCEELAWDEFDILV
jgi:hypothetical protein